MPNDEKTAAREFAKRTLAKIKSGELKRETTKNQGVEFSPERDIKAVEDHKQLLESPLWEAFTADTQ